MDQIPRPRRPTSIEELALREPVLLGGATVQPATLDLVGPDGRRVHLEPRMMQVLLLLAESAGRTVTRRELLDRFWTGMFVDDSALNRVIVQLRRAASEVGGGFAILTVPRLGYRLEIEVADLGDELTAAAPGIPAAWSRRRLLAGGVAMAGVVAGVVLLKTRRTPEAAEAEALHERARILLTDMTPERDAEAIALLREAARLDPSNAAHFGTLALAHQRLAEMGRDEESLAAEAQVREAAHEALSRDPGNADARAALVLITPVYRNWQRAEDAYDRLLSEAPQHVPLLAGHAKLLAEVGRFDDAMRAMDRVFAIEPNGSAYHWRKALGLWAAGRPEAARALIARARRLWPSNWSIGTTAFWLNLYTGHHDAARGLLAEMEKSLPPPMHRFMRQSAEALPARDPELTRATLKRNREAAASNTNMAEQAMAVAGALGAIDEVFLLASAYHFGTGFAVADERLETGETMPPRRRKTLPLFWPPLAAARADPRFDELTRQLGLAAYWATSGRAPDFRGGR
jgi:DNA-binding winged helix-turn-helix (wHTH) protein/tetratricopeptide (TPR) repeat protein